MDGKVVLDPVAKGLVEKLPGKTAGQNMLKALKEEQRHEIEENKAFVRHAIEKTNGENWAELMRA